MMMKPLATLAAAAVLVLAAGPLSAQMYPPMAPRPLPQQAQIQGSAVPSWMRDDGSSSDYPVHNPGDYGAADDLNRRVGVTVVPGPGLGMFPAPYPYMAPR